MVFPRLKERCLLLCLLSVGMALSLTHQAGLRRRAGWPRCWAGTFVKSFLSSLESAVASVSSWSALPGSARTRLGPVGRENRKGKNLVTWIHLVLQF